MSGAGFATPMTSAEAFEAGRREYEAQKRGDRKGE